VRALTIDYGPAVTENVTTGPQDGSPAKPKDLVMSKSVSSVDMRWKNGPSGKGPILGYYIQSKRKGNRDILQQLHLYCTQLPWELCDPCTLLSLY
jgi:hypothetical protein